MIDPTKLGGICKKLNSEIKNCNKHYYEEIEEFFSDYRSFKTMETLWYDEIKNSVLSTNNIVKLIPTLINKEMDLFSSKVNQNLNGI